MDPESVLKITVATILPNYVPSALGQL